jgi:hypothetical protein
MIKRFTLIMGLCFTLSHVNLLFGQAGSYSFSSSTATFTPLTSGTDVNSIEVDGAISASIPLGFTFNFEGTPYTSIKASSDGFISFNGSATNSLSNDLDNTAAGRRPLVAPLWDDLDGRATGSVSKASYEVSGTAPNRVFTFEWLNWEWNYASSTPAVSFQVKLYETSNNIEFAYRWETASAVNNPTASIGLSGVSTFLSVSGIGTGTAVVSNTAETSNIDTVVTDQVFTFTPPACVGPVFNAATNVSTTGATINFTGSAGNYEINWDTTGFAQGAPTSNNGTSSSTSFPVTGLAAATSYDFYVRKDCGSSVYSAWAGPFTLTTPYIPPYLEDWSTSYPSDWTEGKGQITDSTVFTSSSSNWGGGSFSNGGSPSAEINLWSTGRFEWLISPSIDLGTGNNYQANFDLSLTPYNSPNTSVLGVDDTIKFVISTDNGITWSDTNTLMAWHSGSNIPNGNGGIYTVSLAGYSGVVKFAFYAESTQSNADNDIFMDNFEVRIPPACPKPTAVADSNATTTSIDLGWQSNGTGPWYVLWGPCNFNQATPGVTIDTATTTNITLTGMMANTSYEFHLFEDCGTNGFSDTVVHGCVSTACGALSIPFAEGFNSSSNTQNCWTVLNANNDADAWDMDYGSNAFEGDEVAMMYTDFNSGANNDWLISPALTLSNNERLKFMHRVQSSNEPNDFMLLVSTTGTNPADFTDTLLPLASYSNTTYQQTILSLAAYSGPVHIAWHVPAGGLDGWRIYIDDVVVETIPTCLASSNLGVYYISSDSIGINWTPGSTAVNHGIEYGPVGFTVGSGIMTSTVDTFATFGGLGSNSSFDFYVTDTCATGNSVSIGPITVTTLCTPTTAPYLETFDGPTWMIGSSGGFGDTIDGCWSRNSNTGYKWSVFNATTSSGSTGPDFDHTSGTGNFLYTEASSTTPAQALLSSPLIDVSSLTTPYVNFWYHRYGSVTTMGDMDVQVNDGNGWVTMLTLTGTEQTSGAEPFKETGFDVSSFGDTIQVRFIGTAISCCAGDMAIDDFEVKEAPSCPNLTNLTATGVVDTAATLDWDASSAANSYMVWFGPQGFYQGTQTIGGTKIPAPHDSLLIDTLTDLTCYEYVVRAICGPGDSSKWAGPFVFCTPPSCPQPTALGVVPTSITLSAADIYWTTGGSSNFNIEYGPTGFARGSGTAVNSSNDTLSLGSLSSGTGYEFYVRDSCGMGDVSLWSGPFSFVTAFNTNYLEDFTLATPFAWTEADGRISSNTVFTANTSSWFSDNFANIGSNKSQAINIWLAGQHEWLISPSIYLDPLATNLQAEFDVAVTTYNNNNQGYFGSDDSLMFVISTDNGATWSEANTLWYVDNSDTVDFNGEHVVLPLTGYSGYVRFAFYAGSTLGDPEDNEWFVDNFEVRTPRLCTPPTGLTITNVTTDSALVSWNEGTAGFINAEVFYTIGNQPASSGTVINTTNDSVWISGLTNATSYCVYVVEQCANGFSDTLGPVCFSTLCNPQSIPYFENFNTSLGCFTAVDGGTTPDTWMQVVDYNSNTLDGTPFAFVDSDGAGSGNTLSESLESVQLNATGITGALILEFDHYFNNLTTDSGFVEVYDGTSWNRVAAYGSDLGSFAAPAHDSIDITAYAGAAMQVRFRYEDNNVWAWYWAVDNVSIYEASTCPAPTALAANVLNCDSVEISWSSDPTVNSSMLIYGPKGFSLPGGTVLNNVSSPYLLTGLTLNTEYDFYVVDSCSMAAGTSMMPVTFKTDSVGPVMASFTWIQSDTNLVDAIVDFDAAASTGDGLTYNWEFGNSNTGNGVNSSATYTSNQGYTVKLTVTDRCGNTDDTTITVNVSHISIAENAYNAGIDLYPNPSNGNFNIMVSGAASDYSIEVTDVSGKVIYKKANLAGNAEQNINLGDVAQGVYIVRISGRGLNASQRIIIE